MIVKNESKVIKRCFDSVVDYLDYWVIHDTGSSDGTQEIIQNYFKKRKIPGEFYNTKWQNFGYNRTLAVQSAYNKADYLILMDADFILKVKNKDFKKRLVADGYMVKYEGPLDYRQNLLVKGSLKWTYVGVTHEYITCPEAKVYHNMDDFSFIHPGDGGSRSDKYSRDIKLLTKGLEDEPANARYMFYLAQSLRDSGDNEAAIAWYTKRAEAGGWDQEVYYSLFQIGDCKRRAGRDFYEYLGDLLKAFFYRPVRLEALFMAVQAARTTMKNPLLGYQLGKVAINNVYPKDILFINKPVHDYLFLDELSVCAFYSGKFKQACQISARVFHENKFAESDRERLVKNQGRFKERYAKYLEEFKKRTPEEQRAMKNKPRWNGSGQGPEQALGPNRARSEPPVRPTTEQIIVTLTTIPSRIGRIKATLDSIKNQTLKPDKICLCLPQICKKENKEYEIPESIKNDPEITIIRTEKDWGPATKLLGTLHWIRNSEPVNRNSLLITVDDDIIYHEKIIELLVTRSLRNPDAAIGFCGWNVKELMQGREHFYKNLHYEDRNPNIGFVEPVDVLEGYRGLLTKYKFWTDTVFDYTEAPESAFYVDDVWFSGHLAKQNIPRLAFKFDATATLSANEAYGKIWRPNQLGDKSKNNSLSTMKDFVEYNMETAKYFGNSWINDKQGETIPVLQKYYNTVTVILNVYKRVNIFKQQLDLIINQTVKPCEIWVCIFDSPHQEEFFKIVVEYKEKFVNIRTILSDINFKYYGRFQLASQISTPYVCFYDDDIMPNVNNLKFYLDTVQQDRFRTAILGQYGWVLQKPNWTDKTITSEWEFPPHHSKSFYVEPKNNLGKTREVDYLCGHSFTCIENVKYMFQNRSNINFKTGEDMRYCFSAFQEAGIRSYCITSNNLDQTTGLDEGGIKGSTQLPELYARSAMIKEFISTGYIPVLMRDPQKEISTSTKIYNDEFFKMINVDELKTIDKIYFSERQIQARQIGLVVSTYNRYEYLKHCLQYLDKSDLSDTVLILIDDNSYDKRIIETIMEFSPKCPCIKILRKFNCHMYNNLRLGWNILQKIGCMYLTNLDSDAIVKPDWLTRLRTLCDKNSKSLVTGFNTTKNLHKIIDEGDTFYTKSNIGGINMFFRHELLEYFVKFLIDRMWDYNMSYFCNKNNIPILCTKPSVVQHIGYYGLNADPQNFDFAHDFFLEEDEYVLLLCVDSEGHDKGPQRADDLRKICSDDPALVAYNQNGWMKTELVLPEQWTLYDINQFKGTYVKKSYYDEYLHRCRYFKTYNSLLDKLTECPKQYYTVEKVHDNESKTIGHQILKYKRSVTQEETLASVNNSLQILTNYLTKHDIIFWLDAGTALGAYRNAKMIPWDDDADIALTTESLFDLLSTIIDNQLDDVDHEFIFRRGRHSDIIAFKFVDKRTGLFVDGQVYHFVNDKYCLYWVGKTYVYPKATIFPLGVSKFEEHDYPVPNKLRDFLLNLYKDLSPKKEGYYDLAKIRV